jgi:hypothetical protein
MVDNNHGKQWNMLVVQNNHIEEDMLQIRLLTIAKGWILNRTWTTFYSIRIFFLGSMRSRDSLWPIFASMRKWLHGINGANHKCRPGQSKKCEGCGGAVGASWLSGMLRYAQIGYLDLLSRQCWHSLPHFQNKQAIELLATGNTLPKFARHFHNIM